MSKRQWHSTGQKMRVPADAINGKRLDRAETEATAKGEHLWVVTTAHRIDPARMHDPTHVAFLDVENLLMTGATGCFVCEQEYRRELLGTPCPGEPA